MILTLKELAEHLKVNDRTILRMLKTGQIHGVKIGGQWRFNSSQIDSVFFPADEKNTQKTSGEEELVPLSELTRIPIGMPVSRILNEQRIFLDMKAKTTEEAILELTDSRLFNTLVLDIPELRANILEREKRLSTAVGHGIAIPHPREPVPTMKAPGIIVIGRSKEGIDCDAPDDQPVRLFLLIVSQNIQMHLYLMGRLANLLRHESFLNACMNAETPEKIIQAVMAVEREEFLK